MVFKTILENIRKRFVTPKTEVRSHSWASDVAEGIRLACRRPATRMPSFRQMAYIPSVMTAMERRFFFLAALVFVLSAAVLGIRFVGNHSVLAPADGGSYVEGFIGTPQFINPIFATSAKDIDLDLSALAFSGLLRYNDQQEFVGDLASSFEVSQDQKQYTFVLRSNIFWHDGSPFSVEDILFTFASIQDPQWKSPFFARFKNVKVEKIDDSTVRFTLDEPNALFLDYLTIGILPAHLWESVPPASAVLSELNIKPIGTGPYVFSSVSKEKKSGVVKEYLFTRNTRFYRESPHLNEIRVRFYQDDGELAAALKNKQIDGVRPVMNAGGNDNIQATQYKNVEDRPFTLPQYTAVFFNKKNAFLKDRSVREALLSGIQKSELLTDSRLQSSVILLDGPIPPSSRAFTGDVKRYSYNRAHAADLLDKAGFKMQDSGVRKKGDQELVLNLKTATDAKLEVVAEILQKQWGTLGVKVSVETVDVVKFQKDVIRPRSFDMVLATEYVGALTDLYSFWHSTQTGEKGLNLSGTANRDLDELLEAARKTNDQGERVKKLQEAQNLLVTTELPALFLYQPVYSYVVSSRIKGVPSGSYVSLADRWSNIETWYEKMKRSWR